MNSFDLVQDFLTTYSYLAGWRELLPPPTEKSWSYLSGSRYSVETIDLAGAGYLELVATSQDTPGSVRTLDDISISHSSPDSELKLVKRPSNNTQHQLLTDTVKFAATESSRSDEPVSLPPDVVCTPPVCKASMGKYAWADQTNRANNQVESFTGAEGNKAKVKDTPYAELRKSQQKHQATDRARKREASYRKSGRRQRIRAKYASPRKGKLNAAKCMARYATTIQGKLARSVANAKYNAYRAALSKGLSEEVAREKSKLAAKKMRAKCSGLGNFE